MSTYPPPDGEPHARGSILHGFRAALEDLYGAGGLAEVADRLPMATRMATIDALVLAMEWVRLEHVVAWHDALWSGPLRADEHELARFIGRSIELGFGRFHAAFFQNATPERLVARSQELWRYQHSHGDLQVSVDGRSSAVTLRNHPYVGHAASRRVTAESFRSMVTKALGQEVRAAWAMQGRPSGPPKTPSVVPGASGPPSARAGAGEPPSLVVHLSW